MAGSGAPREERRAGDVGDVVRQRARQQRGRVPAVGEAGPDEHPAVGVVVGRAGRQGGRQARRRARPAGRRRRAQAGEVGVEVDDPQPVRGGGLVDGRAVQVGRLFGHDERPAQAGGRPDPAQPQPRRGDLRERRERQRAVLGPGQGGQRRQRRPRGSAARRRGRPRPPRGRGARRPRPPRGGGRPGACGRSGCGTWGPCRAGARRWRARRPRARRGPARRRRRPRARAARRPARRPGARPGRSAPRRGPRRPAPAGPPRRA